MGATGAIEALHLVSVLISCSVQKQSKSHMSS